MKITYKNNGITESRFFEGNPTPKEMEEMQESFFADPETGAASFAVDQFFLPALGDGKEKIAQLIAIEPFDAPAGTFFGYEDVMQHLQARKGNWFITVNGMRLTYEDANAIYQKIKRIHCIEDAKSLIFDMAMGLLDLNEPYMPHPESEMYQEMDRLFQEEHGGCTIAQALSCVEAAVDRFESRHDWTLPDMDQLQYHISDAMERICQKEQNEHT